MKNIKMVWTGIALLSLAVLSFTARADVDAEEFVEEASAKGLAEIETARMALSKGTAPEVKAFAQQMIDDHTAANKELAAIAKGKDLQIADDVELMNKAKAFILKQRDGESFDVAYANNQVSAHEQTIELFREAVNLRDPELKAFAQKTLPKLEHHLRMAQDLVDVTAAAEAERDDRADVGGQSRETHNEARPRPGTTTTPR